MNRWARYALAIALLLFAAARFATVYTDNVNWDEFALLKNSAATSATGVLHSGGRPGLAVLVLLPFAAGCEDEIEVVRRARLLWLGFTIAALLGLGVLLTQLGVRRDGARLHDALLGVALLGFVPAFLQWSIQLRTDQIALACGLWGGVSLVTSRRRIALAVLAGLLFAAGFLSTPKAVYVIALVGLLALAETLLAGDFRWRREAHRVVLCSAGAGSCVLAFQAVLVHFFAGAGAGAGAPVNFGHGLNVFDFYRETIGLSQYRALLPGLIPHAVLAAALCVASIRAWTRSRRLPGRLLGAWSVALLGTLVLVFHAAAFEYFWMTLGLFPAAAFALALPALRDELVPPARRRLVASVLWAVLVLPGLLQLGFLMNDTQAIQRSSLAFVGRNFDSVDTGFHPEGALFCREDPKPFPTFFSQQLYFQFGRDEAAGRRNAETLIERFQTKQVKFLVDSWRMRQFPGEVRRFWAEHYQPYRDSVWVAGRRIEGEGVRDFELVIDGEYRWLPTDGSQTIEIDGTKLQPGDRIDLASGTHSARAASAQSPGFLMLSLNDPPGRAERAFYKSY